MFRRHLAILAILTFALALPLRAAPPSGERPTLAILIVGNQKGGLLTQREREMFHEMVAWRARAGLKKTDLPIISYHVNKDDEREYCEKGLGIKPNNLLFVGLVEHKGLVPQRVIYRINNVVDVPAEASKLMAEVVERLDLDPAILTSPSGAPSGTPSGTPSAAPSGSPSAIPAVPRPNGVTLIRLVTVDHQGNEQTRFLAGDRGVYLNVFLHNDNPIVDQRHTLAAHCMQPDGTEYGRPIGGPFTVEAGARIDSVDMLRRSDPDRHNGWLIKDNALSRKPGHYKARVEIDGEVVGTADFDIVP
jgi:hypothetical protein